MITIERNSLCVGYFGKLNEVRLIPGTNSVTEEQYAILADCPLFVKSVEGRNPMHEIIDGVEEVDEEEAPVPVAKKRRAK